MLMWRVVDGENGVNHTGEYLSRSKTPDRKQYAKACRIRAWNLDTINSESVRVESAAGSN